MKTKIGWVDHSLNPGIFGCSPKSTECANCYAVKMAHRQVAMGNYPDGITKRTENGIRWTGKIELGTLSYMNDQFYKLPVKKQCRVFVTSMADLFHERVRWSFILSVYNRMSVCRNCTFMVLTKWPERLLEFQKLCQAYPNLSHLPNVYHGITAGTQETFDERWGYLRQVNSAAYFVSAEPLLSNIVLPQDFFELGDRMQLIWGGETGTGARPMKPEWARSLRDQGRGRVKLFFKGWGTYLPMSQMIPGVHLGPLDKPGKDDVFVKIRRTGRSDVLDGETFHECLELAQ